MNAKPQVLSLEEVVISTYAAIDDALQEAGFSAQNGQLFPRRGPKPKVDDREILCLSILQELLGYESDNSFFLWLHHNPLMNELFPEKISRQKFSDRRLGLMPVFEKLCMALRDLSLTTSPLLS